MKFLCPTGHPLNAPESLAGKPSRCPRCNTPFIVPQPNEAGDGHDTATGGSSRITPAGGSGTNLFKAEEIFYFLCPNGHKLNGPPTLKGKAGQCPECGARFLIPTDEEIEAAGEEVIGSDEEGTSVGDTGAGGIGLNRGEDFGVAPPPSGAAGMGYIVGRLWERRTENSELEIFLTEGEIIAPDYYSEVLSTSDYGVFAIQEGDGSYAITIVPWSSVRRAGLRRLGELSEDLFQ
jgi:hypothetical protein